MPICRSITRVLVLMLLASPGVTAGEATAAPGASSLDPGLILQAFNDARARGCAPRAEGTPTAASPPLAVAPVLDRVAGAIADGQPLAEALRQAGYRQLRSFHVALNGAATAEQAARTVAARHCERLVDPMMREFGASVRGRTWSLVFAAPFRPPPPTAGPEVAARVLALTNSARAVGRSCGERWHGAVPPLTPDDRLDAAAARHVRDMSAAGFFAHEGSDGSTPATRIREAGGRWRAAGENIAAGQPDAESVVDAWLRSPGHCAAIMNPLFDAMGLAFRVNLDSRHGIFWAQTFGARR